MEQVDGIIGNINDDDSLARRVRTHEDRGTLERVSIEAGERRRSRLRVETDAGTDLGIVPDRDLYPGDVLVLGAARAVVVEFESREAAVIALPDATRGSLAQMTELGHRIGNQHWDLAIDDGALYVPVAADRHIVEDVLGPHLPTDGEISYADVDAGLWIDSDGTDGEDGHGDRNHEDGHGDGNHEDGHGHREHSHAEHSHAGDHDHESDSHGEGTDG
jgi:urease accessory protein